MLMHLALATAFAKDPPLIDLDSTVFLQLGIFLVAGFLLTRLLFRPYLVVRDAREKGTEGAREQAANMNEQAEAKMVQYEEAIRKARASANQDREALRHDAQKSEQQILAEGAQAVQAALESARQTLDVETRAARAAIEPKIAEIAETIASKVLGRKVQA